MMTLTPEQRLDVVLTFFEDRLTPEDIALIRKAVTPYSRIPRAQAAYIRGFICGKERTQTP